MSWTIRDWLQSKRKSLRSREVTARYVHRDRRHLEMLEDRTVPASTAQLVRDLSPGAADTLPLSFAELNQKLYFGGVEGLYVSNGLAAGTKKVNVPGKNLVGVNNLTTVGSTLYFSAIDVLPNGTSEAGNELWKSDGTGAGTVLVKDIFPGASTSEPTSFVVLGNKLLFKAKSPGQPNYDSLWVSDGTAGGTQLVKDINPAGDDLVRFTSQESWDGINTLGNIAFFEADNGVDGNQVWRSDGTSAGTFAITDEAFIQLGKAAEFFGRLYWGGIGGIWRSDGTIGGTSLINTGSFQHSRAVTNLGTLLGFIAETNDFPSQFQIWAMPNGGTASPLVNLSTSYSWVFADLISNGSQLFIEKNQFAGSPSQLYFSNLTQAGTVLIKEFPLSDSFSLFNHFERVGLKVYFAYWDLGTNGGYSYWETDGSAGGTVPVTNGVTGGNLEGPGAGDMKLVNGAELYFTGMAPTTGIELFKVGAPVGPQPAPERADIVGRYGEAGQWYVGKSTGTSFSTSYFGTWSPGITWVDVQTGDFNGDEIEDIVGRWKESGQWYVGLSNGTSFATSLWSTWSPGVTWADVKVGDFNRDGKDDIVGRYKEAGQWYVGISTGTAFATSYWATWSAGITWADVAVGDFDGDGKSDIVGRWKEAGQWYVGKSNGTSFATSYFGAWSAGSVNWVDVKYADFDLDGRTDVVGRWSETGQWYGGISTGTSFHTAYLGAWSVINWVDVSVGDFNGDGYPDVAGRWKETGQWWVSHYNGTALSTSYYGAWTASITWADVRVGDFDGDGKDDLVGRYKEAGQWYVGRSTGTAFVNALWATWSAGVTWADVAAANFA